jgi:HK97 family phage major capsid protein/HK97 family phage prohead protease
MSRTQPGAIHRAYSTFVIKAVDDDEDEDKRVISGIATTPSPDRVGDVVEPKGAQFSLPIPLLWQHNSREPIGHVTAAKVTKDGIAITAKLVKINEAGKLKDRLDEAWQSIKSGLVRGLSIGFRSIEHSFMDDTDGIKFSKWDWLELSAVTIPANADASISAIKAADLAVLSEAQKAIRPSVKTVVSLKPGAAGLNPRKANMKTFKEQIAAFEATRQAKSAELQALVQKSGAEGETMDSDEQEKFDTLQGEIEAIDAQLKRLRIAEKLNIETAKAVETDLTEKPGTSPRVPASVRAKSNLDPGMRFARMAISLARAKYLQKEGRFVAPDEIYKSDGRWMDTAPEVALALKTAVNAGDSTTATWASELAYAQNIANEFIEYLRPMTLLGRISGWRNVPFNVRVGGQSSGTTGYWVGQGVAIKPSAGATTSVSLGITKVAGLSVITKELAMLSTPSAELMVRNDLARTCQQKADTSLIDPNNGGQTDIEPASLTYGATARLASGTDYAAFKADWKSLTSNFYTNNISLEGAVCIMTETMAESLALMVTSLGNPQFPGMTPTGGTLMGRPVFTSQVANTSGSPNWDEMLILLQPGEVFLADDGTANVEASDQVSIHMDDATTMKSTATSTNTQVVSMFQTESIAIKAVRHVNWTKARSAACQFIRSAAYV